MLTHVQIWSGIDQLARRASLSPSGLAKAAGLDPTAFNKSKRFSSSGKERWPSTESLSKVLHATGASFEEFAGLASGRLTAGRPLPLIGFAQAGTNGFFDDGGFPAGDGWDEVDFPGPAVDGVYALEIAGDSMEPVYREGDRIVAAPGQEVRRGDRIVLKTRTGEVVAKQLGRVTAKRLELISLNPHYPARSVDVADIAWVARILWASQ